MFRFSPRYQVSEVSELDIKELDQIMLCERVILMQRTSQDLWHLRMVLH